MKLINVIRRITKLFVDDSFFALAIVAWLAGAAWLLPRLPDGAAWGPEALFGGLACILIAGAFRAARIKRAARGSAS